MKLSKNTIAYLNNFSQINPNILFRKGRVLSTVNESKSFVAQAELESDIDTEFGIYNLKQFLSALSIVDDPEIKVSGKTINITSSQGSGKVKYGCADPSILTFPPEEGIKMPETQIEIQLSADIISQIISAASSIIPKSSAGNVPAVVRIRNGESSGSVEVAVESADGSSRNSFSVELNEGVKIDSSLKSFVAEFPVESFKMIRGDYDVAISKAGVTQWSHLTEPVTYWVATNKTSEFNT
jgi:hypothetical protein